MNRTGKLSHEDYEEIVKRMAEDFIKYFKMKTVDDLDDAWPNKWADWAGTVDWLDELEIVEYLAPDWVFQEFMEDTKPEGMSEEEEEEWMERASEEEGDLIADYVWDQGGMGHGALINDVWQEAKKMLGGKE